MLCDICKEQESEHKVGIWFLCCACKIRGDLE